MIRWLLLSTTMLWAAASDGPAILKTQCVACHNPTNRQGGLDVSTRERLLQGGDRGPGIVEGNPAASAVIQRIRQTVKPGMPLGGKPLDADSIAVLEHWIKDGAAYREPLAPQTAGGRAKAVDHWAFRKPIRPATPKTRLDSWVRNPIDSFLAADWEKNGLKHASEASPRVLLRRLYLDLTGLPPTPEEMRAYLVDRSPQAYERKVDELLSSQRYALRWARHWMDIWRYSDWYGRRPLNDQRFSHRHIWRWRDWIVTSLRADKPYSRMLEEMIAGDEIAPGDPDTLRATGYLVRSFHRFNRNVWLQDTVEHIGFGMLGLTVKCARCHDHKYDPIPQEDYYRLRAFFEPYDVRHDRVPGQASLSEDGLARVFEAPPRKGGIAPYFPPIYKDTFRFIRGEETNPDKTPLSPGIPSLFGELDVAITPVKFAPEQHIPDLRPFVKEDLLREVDEDIANAEVAQATARRLLVQAELRRDGTGARGEAKPTVDYATKIAPIFNKRCRSCHGGIGGSVIAKSGLALTGLENIQRGGWKHGPAIVAGDARNSPVVRFVKGELTPRMPFGGDAVPADEVALIERWIDEMPPADPAQALITARNRAMLAVKHVGVLRVKKAALAARIEADRAKHVEPGKVEELTKKATEAERAFALAQAEELSLEVQQLLADKKSAAAKAKFEAAAKALAQGAETYTPVFEVYPDKSSGRRTALARWLASTENPLTARVAMNHIWLRHFGKPIVRTVTNFGRNGAKPVNQALLDWLAVEFMESNWSMKHMHRLLVTSSAYRMASNGPDSEHFTRMTPRRMEAEVLRDSVLYLAGVLDETESGPDIDEADALKTRRRSLYVRHSPENRSEFLRLFDQPDPTDCYIRTESVVPQQALAAANSSLGYDAARLLADRLASAGGDFVAAAFEAVTGMPPTAEEAAESRRFLASLAPEKARVTFVHALLNHNEFVTIR